MATGLAAWSQTAASNNTADSNVNWQEGQAPSTVNDSARAMMAAMAKWRDDNSGALATGGTSTAYTVTSNQGFASLAAMANQTLRFTMNVTCGAAPTLAVDSLTAKPLVFANGTSVAAGDLIVGTVYAIIYDNVNGVFVIHGGAPGAFPAGTLMLFQQTAAPTGWTKSTTHNDKALRVVSGTASSGGATAFTTVFAARTILQANLPSYTVPNTLGISNTLAAPSHNHGLSVMSVQTTNAGTGGGFSYLSSGATGFGGVTDATTAALTGSVTLTGSITSGGSNTTMDFSVLYVDVILAAKN